VRIETSITQGWWETQVVLGEKVWVFQTRLSTVEMLGCCVEDEIKALRAELLLVRERTVALQHEIEDLRRALEAKG
jgi:hypothetical protein